MKEEKPEPLTIADLVAAGMRLSIECHTCGRFRYLDPARFKGDDPVPQLPDRYSFICKCGSRDVTTRPVQSIHRGEWPKESD